MKLSSSILVLVTLLLFASCSSNRDVVSSNLIQKRKYLKGFHINRSFHQKAITNDRALQVLNVRPLSLFSESDTLSTISKLSSNTAEPDQQDSDESFSSSALMASSTNEKLIYPPSKKAEYGIKDLLRYHQTLSQSTHLIVEKRGLKNDPPLGVLSFISIILGIALGILAIAFLILGFFELAFTGMTLFVGLALGFGIASLLIGILSLILALVDVVRVSKIPMEERESRDNINFGFGITTLCIVGLIILYSLISMNWSF